MTVKTLAELPETYACRVCTKAKPVTEMVLVRLGRENVFLLRRICKECHNRRERNHRRPWKRAYLQRWRSQNHELNESYWRQRSEDQRKLLTQQRLDYRTKNRDALLIQGRLRRRLGLKTTVAEAKRLCQTYGPCYPTKFGLTARGLKECERIRSALRKTQTSFTMSEIRMMVYADGFFIEPAKQPANPFHRAAEQLRRWHQSRRAA